MENYSVVIFVLALMIALSAAADRLKISYPILLVLAGIALGLIPNAHEIRLEPEIIFLIFLPPLLYDAAFKIPYQTFKANMNTISTLAFILVFVTACVIAVFAHYIIPGMSWPLSFVLGAILSATDAVAAISITKGLGLSHNTVTILEGESLINDASAMVSYSFALSAVTGTAFLFWKASLTFAGLLIGGALVGWIMSKVLGFLLRAVRNNRLAVLSFTLLGPFATYLLAEDLHVSGVIAVVILGIGISGLSARKFPPQLRAQSETLWDMILFMLNGLIFIFLGLALPIVISEIDKKFLVPYICYALLITVIALLLRMMWVFVQKKRLQKIFLFGRKRISEMILLTASESVIISWSGMRGIVSLALAIALPRTLKSGQPFPMREPIIFITTVTVLFTIVGQGLILPIVVKRMKAKDTRQTSA